MLSWLRLLLHSGECPASHASAPLSRLVPTLTASLHWLTAVADASRSSRVWGPAWSRVHSLFAACEALASRGQWGYVSRAPSALLLLSVSEHVAAFLLERACLAFCFAFISWWLGSCSFRIHLCPLVPRAPGRRWGAPWFTWPVAKPPTWARSFSTVAALWISTCVPFLVFSILCCFC